MEISLIKRNELTPNTEGLTFLLEGGAVFPTSEAEQRVVGPKFFGDIHTKPEVLGVGSSATAVRNELSAAVLGAGPTRLREIGELSFCDVLKLKKLDVVAGAFMHVKGYGIYRYISNVILGRQATDEVSRITTGNGLWVLRFPDFHGVPMDIAKGINVTVRRSYKSTAAAVPSGTYQSVSFLLHHNSAPNRRFSLSSETTNFQNVRLSEDGLSLLADARVNQVNGNNRWAEGECFLTETTERI